MRFVRLPGLAGSGPSGTNAVRTKNANMKNNRKPEYRIRGISSTRHSLACFHKHLPKIGDPLYVRGIFAGSFNGIPNPWYRLVIRGTKGSMILCGCSWGYGGEGPRGTEEVLKALHVHPFDVEQVAFKCPNEQPKHTRANQVTQVWKIMLPASFSQLAEGEFISRLSRRGIEQQQEFVRGVEADSKRYCNANA